MQGAVGDYESIATVTVGAGGANNITFSSIPQTYSHLQVRAMMRSNGAGEIIDSNFQLKYNGITSYSYHNLFGNGSTATSASATGTGAYYIPNLIATNSLANDYTVAIFDVLDYSNTNKYKTTKCLFGSDINASSTYFGAGLSSTLTSTTSGITSMVFSCLGFAQYSSFALYGIKG